MTSFEDMGLREELLRTLEEEDLLTPTALQQAVIPALRRGTNLVARASSGSGKTLAYTLGILDRLAVGTPPAEASDEGIAEEALRMIVVAPVGGEAERIGLSMVPYAQSLDLQLAVSGAAWGTASEEAGILIAPVREIMRAVRGSEIDLEGVEALVVDGASAIHDLGDWEQVDGLIDLLPRDAQRVIFSATLLEPVEDLIARRVKRALRYPSEPAIQDTRKEAAALEGAVGFVLTSESGKFDLLTRQLRSRRENAGRPPIIFCRNDERAAELAEKLTVRGFLVGAPDDEDADAALVAPPATRADVTDELEGEPGQTISYDVPPDADSLRARHAGDPDAIVLLLPRELAHLREVAARAHFQARSTPVDDPSAAAAPALEEFRADLRTAIQQEDLTAQMLILGPLFEEFTAAEVAAAASAILRSRRPRQSVEAAPAAGSTPPRPKETTAPAGPAPVTWARLFVSVGSRDEIRPGDLVGTLAGEANIPGSRIGKIEIRDSFSIVEVQADIAEQVIRAVNGTTLKGRSLRVDFDRGGPTHRPPTRGRSAPRRSSRTPPRDGR